jgi:hypothetical protein
MDQCLIDGQRLDRQPLNVDYIGQAVPHQGS